MALNGPFNGWIDFLIIVSLKTDIVGFKWTPLLMESWIDDFLGLVSLKVGPTSGQLD